MASTEYEHHDLDRLSDPRRERRRLKASIAAVSLVSAFAVAGCGTWVDSSPAPASSTAATSSASQGDQAGSSGSGGTAGTGKGGSIDGPAGGAYFDDSDRTVASRYFGSTQVVPFVGNYRMSGFLPADGRTFARNISLYTNFFSPSGPFAGNAESTFTVPNVAPLNVENGPPIRWFVAISGYPPVSGLIDPITPGQIIFMANPISFTSSSISAAPQFESVAGMGVRAWKDSSVPLRDDQKVTGTVVLYTGSIPDGAVPADGTPFKRWDYPVLAQLLAEDYSPQRNGDVVTPNIPPVNGAKWAIVANGYWPATD